MGTSLKLNKSSALEKSKSSLESYKIYIKPIQCLPRYKIESIICDISKIFQLKQEHKQRPYASKVNMSEVGNQIMK